MEPQIDATEFGAITVASQKIENDIIIGLDGQVRKRKKKLSKSIYGTSHMLSLDEAKYIYEKGADWLIIGTGQYDSVRLSPEAQAYLEQKRCAVTLLPTPQAILAWNKAQGNGIALFHITC